MTTKRQNHSAHVEQADFFGSASEQNNSFSSETTETQVFNQNTYTGLLQDLHKRTWNCPTALILLLDILVLIDTSQYLNNKITSNKLKHKSLWDY